MIVEDFKRYCDELKKTKRKQSEENALQFLSGTDAWLAEKEFHYSKTGFLRKILKEEEYGKQYSFKKVKIAFLCWVVDQEHGESRYYDAYYFFKKKSILIDSNDIKPISNQIKSGNPIFMIDYDVKGFSVLDTKGAPPLNASNYNFYVLGGDENIEGITELSSIETLRQLFGLQEREISSILSISKECEDLINQYLKTDVEYFVKHDKKTFGYMILNESFKPVLDKYSDEEKRIAFDYILFDSNRSDSLLRFFVTHTFANLKFEENEKIGYLDKTFITVSIFKAVEVLLYEFVNLEWPNKVIYPLHDKYGNPLPREKRNPIYLNKEENTLGTLFKMFDTSDKEINNLINKQSRYSDDLKIILNDFINYSRNIYLHKDLLDGEQELNYAIEDSLDAILLLILMFENR